MSFQRSLVLCAALALALAAAGCRRNLEVLYLVEEDVVLTDLARIDVLIEGVDGEFDVLDAEDNFSPLGIHVISDAVAETILVEIDLTFVDPAIVPGLVLRLKAPGGRPLVRFTTTLTPADGIPLQTLAEAMPSELEYAPGEVVTIRLSAAGAPLDAGVDGGSGDAGTDASTDAGVGTDASDAGIDSGT